MVLICLSHIWKKIKYMPELMTFVYLFGMMLSQPVLEQYLYKRYSEIEGYNWTLESSSSNKGCAVVSNETNLLLKKVQNDVSKFVARNTFCMVLPSIVTGLYLGPLSDRIGRKPILILNILGFLIHIIVCAIIELFNLNILYVHVGATFFGLGGYIGVLTIILSSYLSDVTDTESLAFRLGLIEMILFISLALSNYISGLFLEFAGFRWTFIVMVSLTVVSLLLGIFQLAESLPKEKRAQNVGSWITLPRKIWLALKVPRRGKWKLHLLISTDCFSYLNGSNVIGAILLLRLLNEPFCWSPIDIGYYRGSYFLTVGIASAILIKFLPMVFHHASVVVIALCSSSCYLITLGLAETKVTVYLSLVAGMFLCAGSPVMRGIVAGTVNPHEKGSMFALMGTFQSLITLIGSFSYQALYRLGIKHDKPGFIFIVASFTTIIPIVLILIYMTKDIREKRRLDNHHLKDDNCNVDNYNSIDAPFNNNQKQLEDDVNWDGRESSDTDKLIA